MTTASQQTLSGSDSPPENSVIQEWRTAASNCGETLKKLAGTTEDEFLQIGSLLQDFHQRSFEISAMANRLVEAVSGENVQMVITHLQQTMGDMEAFLAGTRSRSRENCGTMEQILTLLGQVSQPLEGFRKMTKALRMLGISTKIESSRLGELGIGFMTLALDVEKLSHLVSEKSSNILGHRQMLTEMIGDNLRTFRAGEAALDMNIGHVLDGAYRSLEDVSAINSRCGSFGSMISLVSGEVSANISEVVTSMQMHDMTRQQVEHIVEALDRLSARLGSSDNAIPDTERFRKVIVEVGDVCELQSALLRFASSELGTAVRSIVDNLRDVAGKQTMMASETLSTTGMVDSGDGSIIEVIKRGAEVATAVLVKCAQSEREMSDTLSKVSGMIQEVTGFVTDIENIGSEIDLIALNSQVKAAHTGREGAALGVLAEAIKRLSVDAVTQTEAVARTLEQINQFTAHLFQEASEENEQLGTRIPAMEEEFFGILADLGSMNDEMMRILSGLGSRVGSLTEDIERATSGIDVHERVGRMADEVTEVLDRIVAKAREFEPASMEFKENLRHMEERYTMQSERHIHEALARKRGGGTVAMAPTKPEKSAPVAEDSEFGDNVDLF